MVLLRLLDKQFIGVAFWLRVGYKVYVALVLGNGYFLIKCPRFRCVPRYAYKDDEDDLVAYIVCNPHKPEEDNGRN